MKIKLHPEAVEDLENSIEYYENIDINLKNKFLKDLDITFERLKKHHHIYPFETKYSQKVLMNTFPYIILFTVIKKDINILAIFHTKRDPKKLEKRLS
jgi:plasmid stabilization system protein ParE